MDAIESLVLDAAQEWEAARTAALAAAERNGRVTAEQLDRLAHAEDDLKNRVRAMRDAP